jgi:hypothetical protein
MGQAGFVTSEPVHDDRAPATPQAQSSGAVAEDVRSAAADLANLSGRPLAEHVAAYEELHRRLQAALRSVDD